MSRMGRRARVARLLTQRWKVNNRWWNVSSLTFDQLRAADVVACIPQFRDKHGNLCHTADGSDWSRSDWLEAIVGGLGWNTPTNPS